MRLTSRLINKRNRKWVRLMESHTKDMQRNTKRKRIYWQIRKETDKEREIGRGKKEEQKNKIEKIICSTSFISDFIHIRDINPIMMFLPFNCLFPPKLSEKLIYRYHEFPWFLPSNCLFSPRSVSEKLIQR